MGTNRRSLFVVACAAAVLATAGSVVAGAENNAVRAALNTITSAELGHHVDVLADDSFEGREAGSRGGRAAGGYILQLLEENHIQPAGDDGGYFQSFGKGYRNILGVIPGRDPQLQHEYILIGAHYDHVGYGTPRNSFGPTGSIHNGADDNASGTAGVLEVLQAFTMLPEPPRRSILFAFWDCEEKGLLGSKHWTSFPTVPLKQVVLAFNADMIGRLRNNRLEVSGSRSAPGLRKLVSRDNADLGLQLDFVWNVNADSDHYSFFEQNIPFLMLHTGLHDNYHRPSDDAELIEREGMQAVSQLMFRVANDLAEADKVPAFRSAARYESIATRSEFERGVASAPPRLGVSWGSASNGEGLTLTRVMPGSAAELAGLQIGDRLIRCDGRSISDGDQFRLIILAAGNSAQLVVERPGDSTPQEISVSLPGKPVRFGISWDQDRAEPSMVMLTRIVPGSAAEQAGLAAKDRVYQVDGHEFADGQEFGQLVANSAGPLNLVVERQGVLHEFTVRPLADPATTEASASVPQDTTTQ
ncbi:MAG: M20/M25/M40 family metallo-hydrolase [Pirellulaceae bacterium]